MWSNPHIVIKNNFALEYFLIAVKNEEVGTYLVYYLRTLMDYYRCARALPRFLAARVIKMKQFRAQMYIKSGLYILV